MRQGFLATADLPESPQAVQGQCFKRRLFLSRVLQTHLLIPAGGVMPQI